MDYIHGTVASELRGIKNSEPGFFGTPEQDQKFREQMAQIQAAVASFRFPQIGSLYFNEEADEFYIGPELQTGQGPWASATDYYDDLTKHLLYLGSKHDSEEDQSMMLPPAFNFLQRTYGKEREGPFRLTNRDFGAHNILVNEDFKIVGVIDFDGVMAAPIEAVAQYPLHCFLEVEPPGIVDSRPAVAERVAKTIPRLQTFKKMLANYEKGDESGYVQVSDCMESPSASVYQGLMEYQMHQDFVNDKWTKSCLKMLNGGCK